MSVGGPEKPSPLAPLPSDGRGESEGPSPLTPFPSDGRGELEAAHPTLNCSRLLSEELLTRTRTAPAFVGFKSLESVSNCNPALPACLGFTTSTERSTPRGHSNPCKGSK